MVNDGRALEGEVAAALRKLGWDAVTTSNSGDFGADVIGRLGIDHNPVELLVAQCKDWSSAAGFEAIKEVHFAQSHYKATCAIVVSRSGFTRQAKEAARDRNILLLHPRELAPGCALDRSEEGGRIRAERLRQRRVEEQHRQFQEAKKLKEAWAAYDAAYVEYEKLHARYSRQYVFPGQRYFVAGGVALCFAGYLSGPGAPSLVGVVLFVTAGVGAWWFMGNPKPHPPSPPGEPRP